MTVRFHTRGRDILTSPPQTQWQRSRISGPILPMATERKSLLRRVLGL
jgi:hypothetical protein